MTLLIIRHGETVENRRRICQGQTHGTLTEKGVEEARKIGKRLRDFAIDACYTSDLRRAADTAECIRAANPALAVRHDARLRERYFGSFQGQVFPETLAGFAPNAETETPDAIALRLNDFLAEIRAKHLNQTVLIVSHGFTIRVLMSIFKHLPTKELETVDDIKNASLTIVEFRDGEPHIALFNDTGHL